MVHEHLRSLQLDRRAIRRRGWISPEELSRELASLPDVAAKIEEPAPETGETPPASPGQAEGSRE
ncbi:MAG: hypothetical protein IT386_12040 [Deltaproteobacteria bacterium]|nr:hypothetical protein [Deltaproteobacteria bacterium]